MSLFGSNQSVQILLPEKGALRQGQYAGRLLFHRDYELAIRLESGPGLEELTAGFGASVAGTGAQIEYRQGNYLCSFQSKFELTLDRSIPVSLLLIMPLPGTIRRVLDPS